MEHEIVMYDGTTPKTLEPVWGKTVELAALIRDTGTLIVVFDTCVIQVNRLQQLLGSRIVPLQIQLGAFKPSYNVAAMRQDLRLNLIPQLENQPFLGLEGAILVFGDWGVLFDEDDIRLLRRKSGG